VGVLFSSTSRGGYRWDTKTTHAKSEVDLVITKTGASAPVFAAADNQISFVASQHRL
jgi:hypothetical protein